jgi:hypothetical protein
MIVAVSLAGCAAGNLGSGTPQAAAFVPAAGAAKGAAGGAVSADPGSISTGAIGSPAYVLSADEKDLDCKRLTGKLQILILELRSLQPAPTSSLSRSLQSFGASAFGGPAPTLAPQAERARDMAKAEAYNQQLAANDCRSFDLAKALSGTDTTPAATVPAPSKGAKVSAGNPKPQL